MLRSTALFRATIAPSRQILQQTTSSASLVSRRCLATATATATSTAQEQQPNSQPPSAAVQTTSTTTQRIPRPFHVSRTPGNNFPVYQLRKRGGNKKLTTIKKIEGDRKAFKEVLATGLGLDPKDVKINPVTGHVVVEGHHKPQVDAWLQSQGF